MSGVKHHFQGMVADLSAMCPCTSMGSSRLSWVTVSHHDTEIPINHSFIESPSTGWDNDSFSSFDTDEGDPVYCTPPQEEIPEVARGEFQEISSKCNVFPGASAFNEDDISEPFAIPRTSSNAKAKRPSVSFAEGTKFAPELSRGSTTETSNLARKPKLPWGLPKLSLVQSHSPTEGDNPQPDEQIYECTEPSVERDDLKSSTRSTAGGRRRTLSNAQKVAQRAVTEEDNPSEKKPEGRMKIPKMTTIYVSVGPIEKPSKPGLNIEGEGPVKSVLRRFGSFQRAKLGHKDEPKLRNSVDGIQKPLRKSLLQAAAFKATSATPSNNPQNEALVRAEKPHRSNVPHTAKPLDIPAKKPVVPTLSILKKTDLNAEEGVETLDNSDSLDEDADEKPAGTPTPLQVEEPGRQGQTISVADEDSEPKYENVCPYGNNQLPLLQPNTDGSDT